MRHFKIKTAGLLFVSILLTAGSTNLFAQNWELNGNFPISTDFLGSINDQDLRIRQDNTRRFRFTNENWTGLNGASQANANRIAVTLDGNPLDPFSMMHLGLKTVPDIRRKWMNVGTSYSTNGDFLHLGLLERPREGGNPRETDAVLSWGTNDDNYEPGRGPDNFRFLFLTPTDATSQDANTSQGRETMRITPMGNVGIGEYRKHA